MAVDQIHHTEKTEIHRPAPANAHAQFETHHLLADYQKTVGAKKAGGHGDSPAGTADKPAAGSDTHKHGATPAGQDGTHERKADKKPDHLIMTDAFAGLQGNGETRNAKAKGVETPKPPKGKEGKDKPAQNDGHGNVADPTDGQPIKIIGKPNHFDQNKPTVAVLDDFTEEKEKAGGKAIENHGEISAKAAEANGFNVYRIQTNDAAGYGKQMQAIDAKIKSGELPLGKGDAVNVSLGQPNDLPIKGTTDFFGAASTNDTLAQNKDKLLDGIRAKSNDKDPKNADMAKTFGDVTKSNDAIKDMQDRGITVLHAAGNEGTGLFSAHFLNATELNSTKPNGQADNFSADHNLTVRGDGVLPVTTRPADAFSKTSLYQDKGSYEINLQNGKSISGPITEGGKSWTGDKVPFDRNSFDRNTWSEKFKQIPNEQPTAMLSSERLGGEDMRFTPGLSPKPAFDSVQLKPSEGDTGLTITYPVSTRNDNVNLKFTDTPSTDDAPKVAGVLAGTSFSNIGYLADHREEMERLKHEGR
jgi:hypothetical protein